MRMRKTVRGRLAGRTSERTYGRPVPGMMHGNGCPLTLFSPMSAKILSGMAGISKDPGGLQASLPTKARFVLHINHSHSPQCNTLFLQKRQNTTDDDKARRQFTCPKCRATFAFKQGLNRHWKSVHNQPLSTLSSQSCNKKGKIIFIILKEDSQKLSRFSCPFNNCDDNHFSTVLRLVSHCREVHKIDLGT